MFLYPLDMNHYNSISFYKMCQKTNHFKIDSKKYFRDSGLPNTSFISKFSITEEKGKLPMTEPETRRVLPF